MEGKNKTGTLHKNYFKQTVAQTKSDSVEDENEEWEDEEREKR